MDTNQGNPNPNPTPAPVEEKTLWDGSPSQIINLPIYLLCALIAGALVGGVFYFRQKSDPAVIYIMLGLALIPILVAFYRWLRTRAYRYHLTTERLQMTYGILSRKTEDLELYRVKDYHVFEPFTMRMFGLADVVLNTSDDANPKVILKAISDGNRLRDEIRKHVEICRDRKRVRITEFES